MFRTICANFRSKGPIGLATHQMPMRNRHGSALAVVATGAIALTDASVIATDLQLPRPFTKSDP